jgi:hypothetical protein
MRLMLLLGFIGCSTPASSEPRQTPPRARSANETYAEHMTALRKQLAAKGLRKVQMHAEPPFVVVGNGSEETLARDAQTVRWAVEHLEADFFSARPAKILDIYLFRDASSYWDGVERLTGEEPSTPYGFYSKTHNGLFMNIATGGGTLVHEIVHPYVEADFPNAPPWLNEGLGSLFEQSASRDGHIIGMTNWRLAGLQRAIAEDRVPTFQQLTQYDSATFYGDESGVNYAASRYFLYYLQERDLLRDFYRRFRAARGEDPSGYATLVATLGETDMAAFEGRWRAYVGKLTFP